MQPNKKMDTLLNEMAVYKTELAKVWGVMQSSEGKTIRLKKKELL